MNSMILRFHPDQPGLITELKFIGYWDALIFDPKTLLPLKTLIDFDRYREKFGEFALPIPTSYIDRDWNATERAIVIAYLNRGKEWEAWKGSSYCRFGCQINNGSTDLTDGIYVWPEGFAHYVECHGVKPSQEFLDHILGNDPAIISASN
jgi:hypothetical protein